MRKAPPEERSSALTIVCGKAPTSESIGKVAAHLYAGTKLDRAATRLELFRKATIKDLTKSDDPIIALAVKLRAVFQSAEEREHRSAGKMAVLKPRYIDALRALEGRELAPDANGTLRISFGTLRGSPKDPSRSTEAFTFLPEAVKKNTGTPPFDLSKRLLDAYAAKRFGPYKDQTHGEVPVDFLSDLHITGGNSGSATLNSKGELVGLVFDGTYESVASDWVFLPETRSIHVDLRYVLWLLDAVDGGDHLLREMGVSPSID